VLVGFVPGSSRAEEHAAVSAVGGRDLGVVGARTHLLQVANGRALDVVAELEHQKCVRYAEPDWMLAADETPNDPGLGNQWGLLNSGQTIIAGATTFTGSAGADIKATAAWDVATGAAWDPTGNPSAPVVGIVDSGVYYNHPDLAPNIWSDPLPFAFKYTYSDGSGVVHTETTCPAGSHGWDAIRHLCDPYDPAAAPKHGSMVSGIIGASGNNGRGAAGVNWSVRMMGLRWDNNGCLCGYTSQAIEAIEYAVQAKRIWDDGDPAAGIAPRTQGANVRVLSNSWGCCYPVATSTGKLPYDPALLDEVRKAGEANILFVTSAGNSSYDIDPPNYAHGHYPCSFDNANTFGSYDAATGSFTPDSYEQSLGPAKNVICVASSDYNDQVASFSNWGAQTVQLAAPGTKIYAPNATGSYSFGGGTSFSTPFVSGVAALLLSLRPELDVVALKHALVGTYANEAAPYTGCPCGYQGGGAVDQLPAFSGLLSTGGGRLDACKAIPGCGADFALAASPASQSVIAGGGTSYTIAITPANGFGGSVSLALSGLPDGGAGSFSANPTGASATLSVTTSAGTAPGTYPLTITGTSGRLAHTTTVTLEIGQKLNQEITLAPQPDRTFGDANFAIAASASSGLPVSLAASGTCTLSGSTVQLGGAGTCTLTASQAGDSTYSAAATVSRTFAIAKASQAIVFGALPAKTFGDADFALTATATSGLPVLFAATGNCTVELSTIHITAAGSCTVTASQAGNGNYSAATRSQMFTIGKAPQSIVFDALPAKTFGDADFAVAATATSMLPVAFSAAGNCTASGATLHVTGAGSCTVTASQAGDANHAAAADVARSFAIAKAEQQITSRRLPTRCSVHRNST
jgi:subtilisin family serine protease